MTVDFTVLYQTDYSRRFLLKSTTRTLTLSVLCLANASFVNNIDASEHALLELSPASPEFTVSGGDGGDEAPCERRQMRATPHAVSFDTTSHNPSLARIRHSSSSVRSITVTSGFDVTYGFK